MNKRARDFAGTVADTLTAAAAKAPAAKSDKK